MVQFMKALKSKGKNTVIYIFQQVGSEFEPNDHELIEVCIIDLTKDELEIIRGAVFEKYGPDYYLRKKLQTE